MRNLFEKEESLIKKAGAYLEDARYKESPLFKAFSELFQGYRRLYKQLRILVKTSDKQQLKLKELNDQLDIKNRFIRKVFGQYHSDEIAEMILESPGGASLGGEKRVVTVLLSDLRGFTPISERLSAENVVKMINIYLEVMTDVIFKYNGTIDEFLGDGILAVFGAPVLGKDDAQRAVACAVDMQSAMEEVNRRNREAGLPEVEMGIGVNTGELVFGNMGSSKRTKFGVVGSHVNLVARIESYSVGGQILISESTRKSCGPILRIVNRMDVLPKGVQNRIAIYDIGGIYGDYNLLLPGGREPRLLELQTPIDVTFSILSRKKDCTDTRNHSGRLVRMFGGEAEIVSDVAVQVLSDLKMSLFDSAGNEVTPGLYAKVVKEVGEFSRIFRVNFTSVPPEAGDFLDLQQYL